MKWSRRSLFVSGGAVAVSATLAGCRDGNDGGRADADEQLDPDRSLGTRPELDTAHCAVQFFTPAESATVEAITARLIPGDASDPGAREAGVVQYIDCLLGIGGFAEPIYMMPPFVAPDEDDTEIVLPDGLSWSDVAPLVRGGEPSGELPDGVLETLDDDTLEELRDDSVESTTFGVLPLPAGTFDRYGWQSFASPAELYRIGLRSLDDYCRRTHGAAFVDLDEERQDVVLGALEDDEADGFDLPSAASLFEMIRRHTIEGMFADPIYGGNRGFAGWHLIGYPGAHRAWTPVELQTEGTRRPPQGLDELDPTHAGHDHGGDPPRVVSGADIGHDHGGEGS